MKTIIHHSNDCFWLFYEKYVEYWFINKYITIIKFTSLINWLFLIQCVITMTEDLLSVTDCQKSLCIKCKY